LVDSDNARVRKTSRKPETPVSADPQRPYAGPLHERMRWSEPCGDVGRLTEMISPSIEKFRSNVTIVLSEIPCRVDNKLPRVEATLHVNPAHNGEALSAMHRVMPWEALCLFEVWPRND
jgi:hypothetical protein